MEEDRKENTELFRKGAPRKTESKLFGDLGSVALESGMGPSAVGEPSCRGERERERERDEVKSPALGEPKCKGELPAVGEPSRVAKEGERGFPALGEPKCREGRRCWQGRSPPPSA